MLTNKLYLIGKLNIQVSMFLDKLAPVDISVSNLTPDTEEQSQAVLPPPSLATVPAVVPQTVPTAEALPVGAVQNIPEHMTLKNFYDQLQSGVTGGDLFPAAPDDYLEGMKGGTNNHKVKVVQRPSQNTQYGYTDTNGIFMRDEFFER